MCCDCIECWVLSSYSRVNFVVDTTEIGVILFCFLFNDKLPCMNSFFSLPMLLKCFLYLPVMKSPCKFLLKTLESCCETVGSLAQVS